jgi:hypothetical protein
MNTILAIIIAAIILLIILFVFFKSHPSQKYFEETRDVMLERYGNALTQQFFHNATGGNGKEMKKDIWKELEEARTMQMPAWEFAELMATGTYIFMTTYGDEKALQILRDEIRPIDIERLISNAEELDIN